MLVKPGENTFFDTDLYSPSICSYIHKPEGDDLNIPIMNIEYDQSTFTARLMIDPSYLPLDNGQYRLYICGAASIWDINNIPINGGRNGQINLEVGSADQVKNKSRKLPKTGFAPDLVTILPQQPESNSYAKMNSLWLEIPSQKVKANIVGVPETNNNWDTTWLRLDVGWLNGTAYPTWDGNSVITAHVTDANGLPGPFANIKNLAYGNQIVVHQFGEKYIFEVRDTRLVSPASTSYALKHLEGHSYLTLITCQGYNFFDGSYLFRRVVRAVLVKVEADK